MNITIQYFAALAEYADKSTEHCTVSTTSLKELYEVLKKKYNFPYNYADVRVAINDSYVLPDSTIQEGDSIVFITPVAGG